MIQYFSDSLNLKLDLSKKKKKAIPWSATGIRL